MAEENKKDIYADIASGTSPQIVERLRNTIFGTPGKLRYQQTAIEKNMMLLDGLKFISIKKGNRILGTAGVVERETKYEHEIIDSLYIRYLSVLSSNTNKKRQGLSKKNNQERKSSLRSAILQKFKTELEAPFEETEKPGVYYAYVEGENELSKNLCESFGFKTKRAINTFLFSRFSPKKNPNINLILKPDSISVFKECCGSFYENHSFYFDNSLTDLGNLYGYFEGNKIIAGCRVQSVNWKIIEIPGFSGFLMRYVFPKLPFFNRLFNADNLRFLTFDHIWFEEPHSDKIESLIEHLCAELNINLAMIWSDELSKLTETLLNDVKLGLIHKVQGVVKADVMMRPINMAENQQQQLSKYPIFVSAIDMT